MSNEQLLVPDDQVLSTLNADGTRRWLRPRLSQGVFLRWRRIVAYALILLFTALPWITINGKPAILLNLPAREFTFFGKTFLPTDTLLLMLFIASVFVTIFLVTALFGRVWCGWACPQTVYMEFLFRPIERLFDGKPNAQGKRPFRARTVAKYIAYLLASLFLAHVFLSYFVGVDSLFQWMQRSPFEHPTSFIIVMVVTGAMMFDFSFFREQVCILACPYGRLQSVLLDRNSMIIKYDDERGEPRGKIRRKKDGDLGLDVLGDCVDCFKCVTTCPTGIDIRKGLQLECIGCAQCIDACNEVMAKLKRPLGLIRYSSQARMEDGDRHILRARIIIYPILLVFFVSLLGFKLTHQSPVDVTLLRGIARPYQTLQTGEVQNEVRLKFVNRTEGVRMYSVELRGVEGGRLVEVDVPLGRGVQPGEPVVAHYRVISPPDVFTLGRTDAQLIVRDDQGYEETLKYRMQGPFGAGSAAAAGSSDDVADDSESTPPEQTP
jgi:cytochrome c oxidase accessory protein FixG